MLGDAFHFMDRPKVRVHHSFKKAYFVALRRAWFMFEPTGLAALLELLKLDGLSDKDIEHKMYYDFAYFRKRKPRLVPPPEQHYHRVRAVYALYGPMKDSTTGLPLFDKTAWGRASNVLGEIRMGYAADPPGVQLYHQSLDAKGKPAFDEHGLPLLDCSRGTNGVENTHKQITTTFGTWCTGAEMADCLNGERRRHVDGLGLVRPRRRRHHLPQAPRLPPHAPHGLAAQREHPQSCGGGGLGRGGAGPDQRRDTAAAPAHSSGWRPCSGGGSGGGGGGGSGGFGSRRGCYCGACSSSHGGSGRSGERLLGRWGERTARDALRFLLPLLSAACPAPAPASGCVPDKRVSCHRGRATLRSSATGSRREARKWAAWGRQEASRAAQV